MKSTIYRQTPVLMQGEKPFMLVGSKTAMAFVEIPVGIRLPVGCLPVEVDPEEYLENVQHGIKGILPFPELAIEELKKGGKE